MVNDHGYAVAMRANAVTTCTVVDLEGCEHVKIPAHIRSREEARTEAEGIISVLDALSSE